MTVGPAGRLLLLFLALPVLMSAAVRDPLPGSDRINGSSRVPPTIRAIGLDKAGVTLVTAASADFETQVRKETGKWADAALHSSPQLALVKNESPQTIVAYAVSFKSIRPDGKWDFHHIEFKYPDAVVTTDPEFGPLLRDREIRPSEQRLVSRDFEIDPALDNSWLSQMIDMQQKDLGEFTRGEDIATLEIAIDAVLFEDGRLLGPNRSQVDTRFLLLLQRKQELYRNVIDLMASGRSLGDALLKLQPALPTTTQAMEEMLDDHLARSAIGDVRRWRARYGDERAADVLRHAVRREPFAIRKVATE